MNFRVTNKLLQRGNRRVILSHVMWFALFLAIAAPASYLWGFQRQSETFDPQPLLEYWKDSAQAATTVVVPPREIAALIFPFGQAEPETTTLNGTHIWTVRYPLARNARVDDLLREVEATWRNQGAEPARSPGQVLARKGQAVTLLARPDDQKQWLEIHCWQADAGAARISADLFTAQGLPQPPRGAEIMNFSGPETASALAYFHAAGARAVIDDYTKALRREGWQEMPVQDAAAPANRDMISLLFRKDRRHVMVHFTVAPQGGTLVSVVVL